MADDLEDDEVFDEEDLAEGFDGEDLEAEGLEDGADVLGDGEDVVDDVEDEADDVVAEPETAAAPIEDEDDLTLDQDVELALDEVLAESIAHFRQRLARTGPTTGDLDPLMDRIAREQTALGRA